MYYHQPKITDISMLNSSLGSIGDCELLAENTTTDFTSYTIKNLSNYKFVVLMFAESNGAESVLPVTIPVSLFRTMNSLSTQYLSGDGTTRWGAIAKYVSDTNIQLRVITARDTKSARLYGVK